MKRKRKSQKILSLHVFGILDKKLLKVTKVSLDQEELEFDIDLDNIDDRLTLCDFEIKVKFPI
jgi:hypothetical protein